MQVEALLPRLIWHLDEPIADQATIPTYLICGVAAKQVRVVLTGEGGDEIFGGYPRYAWFRLGDALRRRVPAFAAFVAAGLRRAAGGARAPTQGRTAAGVALLTRSAICGGSGRSAALISPECEDRLSSARSRKTRRPTG